MNGTIVDSPGDCTMDADCVPHRVFVPTGFLLAGAKDPTAPCPDVSKGRVGVNQPPLVYYETKRNRGVRGVVAPART